jgi:hypothetical protein
MTTSNAKLIVTDRFPLTAEERAAIEAAMGITTRTRAPPRSMR